MAKKKTTEQLARELQNKMQKIVDDKGGNITSISIEIEGKKFTIAEKKPKGQNS